MSAPLSTARKVVHHIFGDPHRVLSVIDAAEQPALGSGQVRVRVTHSTIHPGDLQLIAARYSDKAGAGTDGERVPGLEAVGIVESAAPGALESTNIGIGTRVAFFAPGAWQSLATVPVRALVPVPDTVDDVVAAQLLINTITALRVLRMGLRSVATRPSTIVQSGASSSVGMRLTAFALREGLIPIRLVRSDATAARLAAALPGGAIISMAQPDWREQVRHHAGADANLAFDGVGGPIISELGNIVNERGTLMLYGALDGAPADTSRIITRGLHLRGVTIGHWSIDATDAERQSDLTAAVEIAHSLPGLFAHSRTFPATALDEAITAVTAPGKAGNVILTF